MNIARLRHEAFGLPVAATAQRDEVVGRVRLREIVVPKALERDDVMHVEPSGRRALAPLAHVAITHQDSIPDPLPRPVGVGARAAGARADGRVLDDPLIPARRRAESLILKTLLPRARRVYLATLFARFKHGGLSEPRLRAACCAGQLRSRLVGPLKALVCSAARIRYVAGPRATVAVATGLLAASVYPEIKPADDAGKPNHGAARRTRTGAKTREFSAFGKLRRAAHEGRTARLARQLHALSVADVLAGVAAVAVLGEFDLRRPTLHGYAAIGAQDGNEFRHLSILPESGG